MRQTICSNCGAPVEIGRCSYCSAQRIEDADLIAAPRFGREHGGWALPSRLYHDGIEIRKDGEGASLAVRVPSERDLGDAIVPVAWIDGEFVDVAAAVLLRFESTPCGVCAGFWIRVRDGAVVTVMAWDTGEVSVSTRFEDNHDKTLRNFPPAPERDPARPVRLSAVFQNDVLTVVRDGRPLGSIPIKPRYAGGLQLRVQVGREESRVVFSDPVARLP
jgi:hypothetical protein